MKAVDDVTQDCEIDANECHPSHIVVSVNDSSQSDSQRNTLITKIADT